VSFVEQDITFSELKSQLSSVLDDVDIDGSAVAEHVAELEARAGKDVYAQLLYILCHLRFSPEDAETHWNAILVHQNELSAKLGARVDLRVAVLDYFLSVNRHFRSPKIIEIKIFEKTLESSFRDEMTGLYNYRYFMTELARVVETYKRSGRPLTVAIFDVDHFKSYNDRHGHLQGDDALRCVARVLARGLRGGDLAARYGGEEFTILLPETTKRDGFSVADRMREELLREAIPHASEQPEGRFSLSGGVATLGADGDDAPALLGAADRALYAAKGRGKNQIATAGDEFRTSTRLDAEVDGEFRSLARDRHAFVTDNLSEQGFQFRTSVSLERDDLLRFVLSIDDASGTIDGVARVVRLAPVAGSDELLVGVRLVDLPFEAAARLRGFLGR